MTGPGPINGNNIFGNSNSNLASSFDSFGQIDFARLTTLTPNTIASFQPQKVNDFSFMDTPEQVLGFSPESSTDSLGPIAQTNVDDGTSTLPWALTPGSIMGALGTTAAASLPTVAEIGAVAMANPLHKAMAAAGTFFFTSAGPGSTLDAHQDMSFIGSPGNVTELPAPLPGPKINPTFPDVPPNIDKEANYEGARTELGNTFGAMTSPIDSVLGFNWNNTANVDPVSLDSSAMLNVDDRDGQSDDFVTVIPSENSRVARHGLYNPDLNPINFDTKTVEVIQTESESENVLVQGNLVVPSFQEGGSSTIGTVQLIEADEGDQGGHVLTTKLHLTEVIGSNLILFAPNEGSAVHLLPVAIGLGMELVKDKLNQEVTTYRHVLDARQLAQFQTGLLHAEQILKQDPETIFNHNSGALQILIDEQPLTAHLATTNLHNNAYPTAKTAGAFPYSRASATFDERWLMHVNTTDGPLFGQSLPTEVVIDYSKIPFN